MASVPFAIGAEQAIAKQNFAISAVKRSAEQGQKIANILDDAIRSAPVNSSRGSNINISA